MQPCIYTPIINAYQTTQSHLLRSLVFSNTCTCSFDLEQTSLSFSALAPLFSMFAWCLVHGSVAPTFRRGSLRSKGRGLAMPYRRSVRRKTGEKKGSKTERREGNMGIQACSGKKFSDEFSRRSNLGGKNPDACLTAMRERDEHKGTAGHEKKEREKRKKSY